MEKVFSDVLDELVANRKNTLNNPQASRLAAKLAATASGKAGEADEQIFFAFFADALFFFKEDASDRGGAAMAFPAFKDVLESYFDHKNISPDFREQTFSSLERFEAAVIQDLAGSRRVTNARTGGNENFSALETPEKQNNPVTHYLVEARNYYLPPDAPELFDAQRSQPEIRRDLKKIVDFFENKTNRAIKMTEPLTEKLLAEIAEIKPKSRIEKKQLDRIKGIYAELKDNLGERWRKTCLAGFRGVRLGAETPAPSPKLFAYRSNKTAWAVRVGLRYLPSSVLEREDIIDRLSPGAVADMMRLCFHSRHYDWKSADELGRINWSVLRGEPYNWRRTWRPRKRRKSTLKAPAENTPDSRRAESDVVREVDLWTDEMQMQTAEGGDPDEFEIQHETVVTEISPAGSSSEAKVFRLIYEEPSWGRNRLTAETLGIVWSWLKLKSSQEPENYRLCGALVFLELQLLTGMPPEMLMNLKLFPSLNNQKSALSDADNVISMPGIINLVPKRTGGKNAFANPLKDQTDLYMQSGRKLSFSVPPEIAERARALPGAKTQKETNEFFGVFDEHSSKAGLKALNGIFAPLERLLGEKISAEKISKSVRTLLREEGSLSELEIALISSEIPHRTASPMFYTNYLIAELNSRRLGAVRNVIEKIIANSREYVDRHGFAALEFDWNDESSEETKKEKTIASEGLRIGSPFVPRADKLSDYLHLLKTEIERAPDFILRHNRQTAYAALTLMLMTGLRPLELFDISADSQDFDSARPTLAVSAKINQKHSEWRSLELAPEAVKILRDYRVISKETRDHRKLRTRFSSKQIDLRLGDSLFFYLRKSFAPVRLTTRGLAELVRDYSYLEIEAFKWRLNSPRHLYRTTACEIGVPEKVINSLLGHQTTGYETLGMFSAAERNREPFYAEQIARKITEVLNLS